MGSSARIVVACIEFGTTLICSVALLGMLALLGGCDPPTLEMIGITPPSAQAAAGTSLQLVATGLYSDGSQEDLTQQVLWVTTNSAMASVGATGLAGGKVLGVSPGHCTMSATLQGIAASVNLTITSATLVSIQVTPASPTIAKGLSKQFTATGVFSDHSTQDLTTQVSWSSSSPAVAKVANAAGTSGLASAVGVGSTTISATSGSISGSTQLSVTSAVLTGIQVTPAAPSTPKGVNLQFTATGIFSDNSTQNLTTQVTWASSNTSVATVSNAAGSQGVASSSAVGSTSISASSGAISASTTLTVTAATSVSIAVTPANSGIATAVTEQFTAIGTYTDNSTQTLTTQVTWASSNTSVATVSNAVGSQGLASSAALGSTTISATSGGISGSTSLTVASCPIGFTTCEAVTIDHTQVGSSDSSSFPLLFSGTYSFLAGAANGGFVQNTLTQEGITVPADAVFTSDAGCTTPLAWEVQSYASPVAR